MKLFIYNRKKISQESCRYKSAGGESPKKAEDEKTEKMKVKRKGT